MKKIIIAATLALAATTLICGCSKAAGQKDYILATGGTSGTYYPFGGVVANIWNSNIEGMSVTAQATGASAENLRLINRGEAEYAIVQNDVMDYAYNGTDLFEGEKLPNVMTVGTLYPECVQIAVAADSGIKSVADFKGKRISVGDAGSGVEFNAKQILEGYGLTFDDIKKNNLSFKESAEGIQNGTLDGCFITAAVPNSAFQELAFTAGLVLIPVDGEAADKICEKYGYYTKSVIPAGTYKGTDTDTPVLSIKATLAVNGKLDEESVYNMTKTLFENLDELAVGHAKGKEVSAAAAVNGVSVPFHPGAERYFRELGLIK